MRCIVASLLAISMVVAIGCGGGGAASEPDRTDLSVVRVTWPVRSRVLYAPSSALSAKVTVHGADQLGKDVTFTVNRDLTQTASHVETYPVPGILKMGNRSFSMTFYSDVNGKGVPTASFSTPIKITYGGFNLPTVTPDSVVASVTINPGSLKAGRSLPLSFTAYDANSQIVALSPGSAKWFLVNGQDYATLSADGTLVGTAAGTCRVSAMIDGVSSPVTDVQVLP